MKMKQKLCLIGCIALTAICLTGCGKKEEQQAPPNFDFSKGATMGTVNAIDADQGKITIAGMQMGGMPTDMKNGDFKPDENFKPEDGQQPPEMPEGGKEKGDGQQPPEMPEGAKDGDIQMPQTSDVEYTVSDSATIQDKDGNTIALKDINTGDFVEYSVENEVIVSLSVKEMPQGNNTEKPQTK